MATDPLSFDLGDIRTPRAARSAQQPGGKAHNPATSFADLAVCPFTVVQDSREHIPWEFSGLDMIVPVVVRGLKSGDYSIDGLENLVTVERKTAEDLIGSVCGGHARFEREHQRMLGMVEAGGRVALVCEGNYAAMDDQLRLEGRGPAAATLLGTLTSWPCKYRCPWYFAGDRRRAEIIAFRLLWKWYKLGLTESRGSE